MKRNRCKGEAGAFAAPAPRCVSGAPADRTVVREELSV